MSDTPKPHRPRPPHNPGVRELVSAKRRWSSPPKREDAVLGFRGWHERGYLPHRDEPGLTQFVTFHLADSFPAALCSEWQALLQVEDDRERRKQLEAYLDRGRGECHLRQPEIAKLVEDALRFHHQRWYELLAWVIMPNHVHLLMTVGETPLSKIIKELKRYTSREANKLLGRGARVVSRLQQPGKSGALRVEDNSRSVPVGARIVPNTQPSGGELAFWAEDYFDTYMRDAEHGLKTRRYIENNPTKAFLVRDPKEWPWSSARLRDENGVLKL